MESQFEAKARGEIKKVTQKFIRDQELWFTVMKIAKDIEEQVYKVAHKKYE